MPSSNFIIPTNLRLSLFDIRLNTAHPFNNNQNNTLPREVTYFKYLNYTGSQYTGFKKMCGTPIRVNDILTGGIIYKMSLSLKHIGSASIL